MVWYCIFVADSACQGDSSRGLQETCAASLQWCFRGQGAVHSAASAAKLVHICWQTCNDMVLSKGCHSNSWDLDAYRPACAAQSRWSRRIQCFSTTPFSTTLGTADLKPWKRRSSRQLRWLAYQMPLPGCPMVRAVLGA